jgi:hypothetical protein
VQCELCNLRDAAALQGCISNRMLWRRLALVSLQRNAIHYFSDGICAAMSLDLTLQLFLRAKGIGISEQEFFTFSQGIAFKFISFLISEHD